MATKKFPNELNNRGTVLPTDKLLIHNITTGATEYTSASGLFAAFGIAVLNGNVGINTFTPQKTIDVSAATGATLRITSTRDGTWGDQTIKGQIEFYGSDTSGSGANVHASIKSVSEGTFGVATSLIFSTSNAGEEAVKRMKIQNDGTVYIGDVAASGGSLVIGNNCSALTFTDRTPYYNGDAISEIKKISGINGLIDHNSLPSFVQVHQKRDVYQESIKTVKGEKIITKVKIGEEITKERDLGAMISVLTKAVQQLTNRIEKLEKK